MMPTINKLFVLMFFLFTQPTTLSAQLTSKDIQENHDKLMETIENMANERTARTNAYTEKVDMFAIDDIDISPEEMYLTIDDNRPSPETIARVYMGDKMLLQRSGFFADCINPTFETHKDFMMGWEYFIKANVPICKTKPKDKKYTPSYANGVRNGGEITQIIPIVVKMNKKTRKYQVCLSEAGMKTACKEDVTEDEVNLGPAFVSVKGGLQRTIEYAGKSGNQIKFIYAEYTDGMARDAFTREFEVDLNEGNTAAYKGAVFEIIEANNAEITYKVIRHFP